MNYENHKKYFFMKGMFNHALRQYRMTVAKTTKMLMEKLSKNPLIITKKYGKHHYDKRKRGDSKKLLLSVRKVIMESSNSISVAMSMEKET